MGLDCDADEIADPHNVNIQLEISGEVLQNSNTRELIFKIPELIAFLSSVFTLEAGDIVSTGRRRVWVWRGSRSGF